MKKAKFKTDCWIWMYGVNSGKYGILKHCGKWIEAHKFMYETLVRKTQSS